MTRKHLKNVRINARRAEDSPPITNNYFTQNLDFEAM